MVYRKLFLMLLISFVVMYGVMFLNVDKASHIYLSLTRTYMSLLMVLPMCIIMIMMMKGMYANKKLNTVIITTSVALFTIVLAGLRTQTPVGDNQYLRGMISHHSSAIMTSKNASLEDPQVRILADSIIASQEREILEMKAMIERLKK